MNGALRGYGAAMPLPDGFTARHAKYTGIPVSTMMKLGQLYTGFTIKSDSMITAHSAT